MNIFLNIAQINPRESDTRDAGDRLFLEDYYIEKDNEQKRTKSVGGKMEILEKKVLA